MAILLESIKDDECHLGYDLCHVKSMEKESLSIESSVSITDCATFHRNEITSL